MSDLLDGAPSAPAQRGWTRAVRPGLLLLLGAGALVWVVQHLAQREPAQALAPPTVQQVALLDQPPPPPPPLEQELPEPVAVEEVAIETEPVPEAPAPDPVGDLGVVGDGLAGADAFGLRSRRDGIDAFRAIGAGMGGGAGAHQAHQRWSEAAGAELAQVLRREDAVRQRLYRVELRLQVDDRGQVVDCALRSSSGDPAVDDLIRERCVSLALDPPPANYPQPLRLAVKVRPMPSLGP